MSGPTKVSMIFLDLDGTLLNSKKTISEDTVKALKSCHKKGIKICLASGRMTDRITAYEEILGFDFYIVGYNGARCVTPKAEGRKVVYDNALSTESANKIIDYALEHDLCLNIYTEEKLYAVRKPQHEAFIDLYARQTGSTYYFADSLDEFRSKNVTKMLVIETAKRRDELFESLQSVFEPGVHLLKSMPEYLEFLQPGTDKGITLKKMCESLNIPVEETVAFGDGDNDVGLLHTAGWGIAMGNACEDAKKAANHVSQYTNDEDAIAKELKVLVPSL